MSSHSGKLRKIYPIVQLIISVFLLIFIVYKYHISFFKRFSQIPDPNWLFISLIITLFFIPLLAAFRWKIMLYFSGIKETIFQILKINFISIFWGIMLPSSDGFAAIRLYLIEKRHPDIPGKAGSTVVVEKIFGFLLLCLIGIGFSFSLPHLEQLAISRIILFAVIIFISFLFILISHKKIYIKLSTRAQKPKHCKKLISFILSLHGAFTDLPFGKIIIRVIPIMIIFQIVTIINVSIVFRAYGAQIPFMTHLALVPIIQIISLIPVTISGFGVREGAFVYFYESVGVPPSIALSVSILNFLILTGIPALIGGFLSILIQIHKKDIKKNA